MKEIPSRVIQQRRRLANKSLRSKSLRSKCIAFGIPLFILIAGLFLTFLPGEEGKIILSNSLTAEWPSEVFPDKKQGDYHYLRDEQEEALVYYVNAWNKMEKVKKKSARHVAILANNVAGATKAIHGVERSVEWYDKAVTADPNHFESLFNYGNTLANLGKRVLAQGHYQKALQIRPNSVSVLKVLASVIRHDASNGKDSEGLLYGKMLLLKAFEIDPTDSEIMASLGLQYMSLHDIPKAVDYLQMAADLGHKEAKTQLVYLLKAANRVNI